MNVDKKEEFLAKSFTFSFQLTINNYTSNYEQIDFDPTELQIEKIKSEIYNLKNENLLTLKTANSLLEENI